MMQERMEAEKVHVIACGALAREILAVRDMAGLDHMSVACLPAIWHNHPQKIAPAVDAAIEEARAEGATRIFVAYADCGTGGALDKVLEKHGVDRIAGPHCYSFFSGNEAFQKSSDDDVTTFFLTDFLARQFEAFVVGPLGLDRHPELREMYFGNYEKLVYLAQTEDEALTAKAREAAAYLGLAFERRFTAYGDLATSLADAAQSVTPRRI
jgi:hypothetical protein